MIDVGTRVKYNAGALATYRNQMIDARGTRQAASAAEAYGRHLAARGTVLRLTLAGFEVQWDRSLHTDDAPPSRSEVIGYLITDKLEQF